VVKLAWSRAGANSFVSHLKMIAVVASSLILASGSPRRRDLLVEAGLKFKVISPDVPEAQTSSLSLAELTICNASRKALAVARRHREAVVLGADTLVALRGKIIAKPIDAGDAVRILQRLRGEEHQVCTGVFICLPKQDVMTSFHVISHVRFLKLTDKEVRAYLAKINPLDKAGAYAAQGHGSEIISAIRGSYTNVVGLPMDETLRALAQFRIFPEHRATTTRSGSRSQACFRRGLPRKRRSNLACNPGKAPDPPAPSRPPA